MRAAFGLLPVTSRPKMEDKKSKKIKSETFDGVDEERRRRR